MLNKSILFVCIFFMFNLSYSQDDQLFSVFTSANRWINPATIDTSNKTITANLYGKYQTKNISGDAFASFIDVTFAAKGRRNYFGFVYYLDNMTYQTIKSGSLNYTYSKKIKLSKLNIGFAFTIFNQNLSGVELNKILPGGNFPDYSFGKSSFDFDVGATFRYKKITCGFSSKHFPQPVLYYNNILFKSYFQRSSNVFMNYLLHLGDFSMLAMYCHVRIQNPHRVSYQHYISSSQGYLDEYHFYRNNSSNYLLSFGSEIIVKKNYSVGFSLTGFDNRTNNIGFCFGYTPKDFIKLQINYFLPNNTRGNNIEGGLIFKM